MSSKEKQHPQLLTEIIDKKNYKLKAYTEAFCYSDRTGWFRKLNKLDTFGPVDIARLSFVLELPPVQVFEALYRQVTGRPVEEVVSKKTLDEIHGQTGVSAVKKKRQPKKEKSSKEEPS